MIYYKAFIFDFDFTLVDAGEAIVECFNYGFRKLNLEMQKASSIKKTIGLPLDDAFYILTNNDDENLMKQFKEIFKAKADECMADGTKLLDGAVEILSLIKDRGKKTIILTNKFRYRIEQVLEKYNISHLIDMIIGYEDVEIPKPNPEGILKIIDCYDIEREEFLYIGDSLTDAETAEAADIDFIGIVTGTTPEKDFYEHDHIDVIDNLRELKGYIMKQNVFDNELFFNEYKRLRDKEDCANLIEEKPFLFSLLPDMTEKTILDLGCGYGENCMKFIKLGAEKVIGIDISEKMLDVARNENCHENIEYKNMSMEEISGITQKFDIVISSLAIHYVRDFNKLAADVYGLLNDGGLFIFSQEHPLNTAPIDDFGWCRDENHNILHFKLRDYNLSGERVITWVIDGVVKYHRKFDDIVNGLSDNQFLIVKMIEPRLSEEVVEMYPQYEKNLHKPNFLMIKARKI